MINFRNSTMSVEHGEGKVELIRVKQTRWQKFKDDLCWLALNLLVGFIFLGLFGLLLFFSTPVHSADASTPPPTSYTLLLLVTGDGYHSSQSTFPGYPTWNACADASKEVIRQKKAMDIRLDAVFSFFCVPTYNPPKVKP